jgi:hypothetical protein
METVGTVKIFPTERMSSTPLLCENRCINEIKVNWPTLLKGFGSTPWLVRTEKWPLADPETRTGTFTSSRQVTNVSVVIESLVVLAGTADSRDVTAALTWAKTNRDTLRRLWREYSE